MSAGTCKHCKAWLWHRAICFDCGKRQLRKIERRVLWFIHDTGEALMEWAERKLFDGARIEFNC